MSAIGEVLGVAHNALLLAIPVPLFCILAFIKVRFTLGQGNFTFHQVVFPVEGGTDAGMSLLVDASFQLGQFPAIEQ